MKKNRLLAIAATMTLLLSGAQAKDFATVNGEPVTIQDIDELLKIYPNFGSFSELDENTRKLIVEQAVEKKLVQQLAIKEGIKSTAEFKKAIRDIGNKLAVEVWMKHKYDTITIPKADVEAYYMANKKDYVKEDEVKARHIIVESEQKAKELIAKLDKTDKNFLQKEFIKLAGSNSIGPSATNGGDLGWFGKGKMLQEFWDAANKLEEGEYTKEPLKTQFGYHIIYLDGKHKAYTIKLEDVYDNLEDKVRMGQFQKMMSANIENFKANSTVVFEK
jgi:peptidylprolyl isomerase